MKEEKRPYSLTTEPTTTQLTTTQLTEFERIRMQMISDVSVALIGCCNVYPCPKDIAEDAKLIVEMCLNKGKEVEQ